MQILSWTRGRIGGLFFSLDLHDIRGLRSFRSLHEFEADTVSLVQCSISVSHSPGVVDEHIGSVFTADESIAFGAVEPLNLALILTALRTERTARIPRLRCKPESCTTTLLILYVRWCLALPRNKPALRAKSILVRAAYCLMINSASPET